LFDDDPVLGAGVALPVTDLEQDAGFDGGSGHAPIVANGGPDAAISPQSGGGGGRFGLDRAGGFCKGMRSLFDHSGGGTMPAFRTWRVVPLAALVWFCALAAPALAQNREKAWEVNPYFGTMKFQKVDGETLLSDTWDIGFRFAYHWTKHQEVEFG